eukprot:Rmarinus@m.616
MNICPLDPVAVWGSDDNETRLYITRWYVFSCVWCVGLNTIVVCTAFVHDAVYVHAVVWQFVAVCFVVLLVGHVRCVRVTVSVFYSRHGHTCYRIFGGSVVYRCGCEQPPKTLLYQILYPYEVLPTLRLVARE